MKLTPEEEALVAKIKGRERVPSPVEVETAEKRVKAKSEAQTVCFRTDSGRLIKGRLRSIGNSRKPCTICLSTASTRKWELRYTAKENETGTDRFCPSCKERRVIRWEDCQEEYELQPSTPRERPTKYGAGPAYRPRVKWEEVAEREMGPNWRER